MLSAFDACNTGEGFVFVNWAQKVRGRSHSFRYSQSSSFVDQYDY